MIRVAVDDLAFLEVDAIIRPVTADLGATTPLLRRLELAAGPELLGQTALQEPLPIGAAVVTGAGALPADLLVHAVVMSRTERVTAESVRLALTSALQRVEAWQIGDVAIPPFGLGAGNLDIEESAEIMMRVLVHHLRASRSTFPSSIALVAETPEEAAVLSDALVRSGLAEQGA